MKQTSNATPVIKIPETKPIEPTDDPIEAVENYQYVITSGQKVKSWNSNGEKRTESGDKGVTAESLLRKSSDFLAQGSSPSTPQRLPQYRPESKMVPNTLYEATLPIAPGQQKTIGLLELRGDKQIYAQPAGYNRARPFSQAETAYQWLASLNKKG